MTEEIKKLLIKNKEKLLNLNKEKDNQRLEIDKEKELIRNKLNILFTKDAERLSVVLLDSFINKRFDEIDNNIYSLEFDETIIDDYSYELLSIKNNTEKEYLDSALSIIRSNINWSFYTSLTQEERFALLNYISFNYNLTMIRFNGVNYIINKDKFISLISELKIIINKPIKRFIINKDSIDELLLNSDSKLILK